MALNLPNAAIIQQFYGAFFGRPADPSGLAFWLAGVTNTGDMIGTAIKNFGDPRTPEFAATYPAGTSDEAFLAQAYKNMFNRAPDAGGNKFWADALRDFAGAGMSVGEARAKILQSFIEAANGQVGTNDKSTITNKQFVADYMTASVKTYGTEAVYMSHVDKAKGLLASVDHTQASVDAALAKIKVGGIYESSETPPAAPNFVDTYEVAVLMTLSNDKQDILRFDSASDAPFGYIKIGNMTVLRSVEINKFDLANDRIDLTAFHLNAGSGLIATGFTPWVVGQNATFNGSTPSAYKTYEGFFSKPIVTVAVGSGASQATEIFVDVNGNGNLDPGADMWITLVGVWQGSVTAAAFNV